MTGDNTEFDFQKQLKGIQEGNPLFTPVFPMAQEEESDA